MSKKVISLFLAALLIASNMPIAFAATETADFEGLGYSDKMQIVESVAIEGFKFSTSTGNGMEYRTSGGANGTAGIIAYYISSFTVEWIEFQRNDGAAFALHSMFLKNIEYTTGVATHCKIEGLNDSGSVAYSVENVDLNGAGTVAFTGWDHVHAVRITATAGTLDSVHR